MLWSRAFWQGAAERAVKTFFQVLVAVIAMSAGADLVPQLGVTGVDWLGAVNIAALAAVLSVATSIGNADFTAGTGARRAADS